MSAVMAEQGTLEGMPVVQAPALGERAIKVALLGELLHQAVVRATHHGAVKLEVVIRQQLEHHPRALPLLAVMTVPDLGSFHATHCAAQDRAAHMREGTEVVVLGRGLELARHEGTDVFRLIHVDGINLTSHEGA
jgi:hypothetical protein